MYDQFSSLQYALNVPNEKTLNDTLQQIQELHSKYRPIFLFSKTCPESKKEQIRLSFVRNGNRLPLWSAGGGEAVSGPSAFSTDHMSCKANKDI